MKIPRLNAARNLRASLLMLLTLLFIGAGCSRKGGPKQGVRPRTLRDVP
ncbi:MAG: hypothetical protein JOZ52_03965, partial [Acidobacteria bacterium]|nr:hypothetical protein [Acidobacteriota bacterium]